MILAALAVFQAWIWMHVGMGKCLIFMHIRLMDTLFEF